MINTLDKNCSSKFGLKQEQSKKNYKNLVGALGVPSVKCFKQNLSLLTLTIGGQAWIYVNSMLH
jgi:hypothetical protein